MSLHRPREMRNLFVELSQILDAWKQNGWNSQELEMFLVAYQQCALEMDALREIDLKLAWERYMKVITKCVLFMF